MRRFRFLLPPMLFLALAAPARAQEVPQLSSDQCFMQVIHGGGIPNFVVYLQHNEVEKAYDENVMEAGAVLTIRVPCDSEGMISLAIVNVGDRSDFLIKEFPVPERGTTQVWCLGIGCKNIRARMEALKVKKKT